MIELRGVTKAFGAKRAVDQLDLRVRAGELFAFLGPNGAGKTTTIKMVCGLLAPTSGVVRVGGHPATSQEARQLLAYVPDQPYLYEKLTGREFLRFVVEMYGLDRRTAALRLDELIETFEMGDYVDELCENYSQGMKQRVVFASALVHDPKVLIVDEPLVGLDPRSARIVKDLFVAQARSGVAVLMSTHLLSIAEELADTIGIVDHGRMLAQGTLAELRERLQSDGPLEDLFLTLTGGSRPGANGKAAGAPGRACPHDPPASRPASASPTTTPGQAARAFRRLRARLLRNTVRALLSGSRLRLVMVLVCSLIFWVGLFGLFFGGFQFISKYVDLVNTVVEYLLQHVLPVAAGHAVLLDGDHRLHRAVPVARGGLPADDARPRPTGSSPTSSWRRWGSRAGASCCWAAR